MSRTRARRAQSEAQEISASQGSSPATNCHCTVTIPRIGTPQPLCPTEVLALLLLGDARGRAWSPRPSSATCIAYTPRLAMAPAGLAVFLLRSYLKRCLGSSMTFHELMSDTRCDPGPQSRTSHRLQCSLWRCWVSAQNTAIFSVVNGVLLSRCLAKDPARLVQLSERSPDFNTMSVAYPNFKDWHDRAIASPRWPLSGGRIMTLPAAGSRTSGPDGVRRVLPRPRHSPGAGPRFRSE
jgi:hypothetical protein